MLSPSAVPTDIAAPQNQIIIYNSINLIIYNSAALMSEKGVLMRGRKKLSKHTSEKKFTNSALRTKKLNISAKPRRGGIRM